MFQPPDDVPDFDSNRVMLDIPGELFGTAFSVVTDISKIVGDVILVSLLQSVTYGATVSTA